MGSKGTGGVPSAMAGGAEEDGEVAVEGGRNSEECKRVAKDADQEGADRRSEMVVGVRSALDHFEEVASRLEGKPAAVFLDYDGTLAPIVDDPAEARIREGTREAVRAISRVCPTAIVSGRSRDKVQEFVGVQGIFYAGSHGLDISGPDPVFPHVYSPPREVAEIMDSIYARLSGVVSHIPGAFVEHNTFALTVHTRCASFDSWFRGMKADSREGRHRKCAREDEKRVEEAVNGQLKGTSTLKVTPGNKVIEVRPSIKWDKGAALSCLMRSFSQAPSSQGGSSEGRVPLYIGDDITDEDAFGACLEHGGLPVIVSPCGRPTYAEMSLRSPDETREFLLKLASRLSQSLPLPRDGDTLLR